VNCYETLRNIIATDTATKKQILLCLLHLYEIRIIVKPVHVKFNVNGRLFDWPRLVDFYRAMHVVQSSVLLS